MLKNELLGQLKMGWRRLRIYKREGGFAVDYRIIKRMAKMMGVKHAH